MRRILSLTMALALMAALFTGCGCEANVSTHPGGMITEETIRPTVMPKPTATHATEPRDTSLPTVTGSDSTGETGGMGGEIGGGNGSAGGSTGGSGGTNGGTGTNESTTPTDGTMPQRSRPRNATR